MAVQGRTKVVLNLLVMLLVLAGSYGVWRWYRVSHYPQWVASVQFGDSEASVIRLMGLPDRRKVPADQLRVRNPDCDHAYLYGRSHPPEWWVVGFNAEGVVVSKSKLATP